MTILRGRAATPVRPGFTIKGVLLGEIPLATGDHVTEAAITDLHGAYKELIRQENDLRPRARRLRPMTAFSFRTLFKFAQLLDLVELVREEPMVFPPPGGNLLSIRGSGDEAKVVKSTRRVFKLTAVGAEDERSWSNLNRAWREEWPAPAKLEYIEPVKREPPPRKPPPKKKEPVEQVLFTPFVIPRDPTPINFRLLAAHLRILDGIGIDNPEVVSEVARLSTSINSWEVDILDGIEAARSISFAEEVTRLTKWSDLMTTVREGLDGNDLVKSTVALETLAEG